MILRQFSYLIGHSFWLLLWILGGLLSSGDALALLSLKQIEVKSGSEIHLNFDGKVARSQVNVEFLNDIIQVSLNDVSVYPAKILPVRGSIFTKIFAYQYTPRLVRCRFSVKGKAEDFKNRFRYTANAKGLKIEVIHSGVTNAVAPVSQVTIAAVMPEKAPLQAVAGDSPSDLDEKALLKKVMESSENDSKAVVPSLSAGENSLDQRRPHEKPLTGAKPFPSVWKAFAKMMGLLVLLILGVVAVRRLQLFSQSRTSGEGGKGFLQKVARFAKGGMASSEKVIEVVSTHYLDPKKYIALVKVKGKLLVLGVSNDSISLITRVGANGEAADADWGDEDEAMGLGPIASGLTEQPTGGASFSDFLGSEKAFANAAISSSIRSRVRSKLEGLKPL